MSIQNPKVRVHRRRPLHESEEETGDVYATTAADKARQIASDLVRVTHSPVISSTVDSMGAEFASANVIIGIPSPDGETVGVPVTVDAGPKGIVFKIAGEIVSQCGIDLDGFPDAQGIAIKAIERAKMKTVDVADKFSATPNYAGLSRTGGPYG